LVQIGDADGHADDIMAGLTIPRTRAQQKLSLRPARDPD